MSVSRVGVSHFVSLEEESGSDGVTAANKTKKQAKSQTANLEPQRLFLRKI